MWSTSTRSTLVILLGAALTAAPQDQGPSPLQRAIVVETHEHDVATAAAKYREIGEAGGAEAGEAWLRLGSLQQRIGKVDEARASLERAVRADPKLAPRVRELAEQDAKDVDPKLRERVLEIVRNALAKTDVNLRDALIENLRWLGDAAAPVLAEIVVTRKHELDEATFAARSLLLLGKDEPSPALVKLLAHPDATVKRLLIRASIGAGLSQRVRDQFLPLFADGDPKVRAEAVSQFGFGVDVEKRLALTADPDPGVRRAALELVRSSVPNEGAEKLLERLLARILELKAELTPDQLRRLLEPFGNDPQTEGRRRLFLRALADPVGEHLTVSWRTHPAPPKAEPALAEEAFALARSLGPVTEAPTRRQSVLASYLATTVAAWEGSATEQVLELVRMGYETPGPTAHGPLSGWLGQHSDPRLVDDVLQVLEHCRVPDLVIEGLVKPTVTVKQWAPLRKHAEQENSRLRNNALTLIGTSADPAARKYLLERARKDAVGLYILVAETLLRAGKVAAPELVELMQVEAPSNRSTPVGTTQTGGVQQGQFNMYDRARNGIFVQLVEWNVREALAALPRAYQLGLEGSSYIGPSGLSPSQPRGLVVLGAAPNSEHSFDEATLAATFDACLATLQPDVYRDAMNAWHKGPIPDAVFEVIVKNAPHHPTPNERLSLMRSLLGWTEEGRGRRWTPAMRELIELGVRSDDANLRRDSLLAAGAFAKQFDASKLRGLIDELIKSDHSEKVLAAAQYLVASRAPNSFAELAPLARHDQGTIRAGVVKLLLQADREQAVPLARALLDDRDVSVRLQAVQMQQTILDPLAVKSLLTLLRDPNEYIRKEATDALNAIDLYQKHWKRWAATLGDAAGVPDAASAAEALARQALDAKERNDVRLAALASLGTLAVPETLPLLVQLLKDPHPEVAAAARAALDKINAAGGKK